MTHYKGNLCRWKGFLKKTAFHLKLEENPNAAIKPHRFGASTGRNALIKLLQDYQTAGVNHMALQLRHSGKANR
jgi:hypothetical protein